MKTYVSILLVCMLGLTAEVVGQEENTLYDQEALETQARVEAAAARKMAESANRQAEAAREQARSAGMMAAAGSGALGGGMMMGDDYGNMIITPTPPPGMGSTGMALPSFEMQQGIALIVPAEPLDGETMKQVTEDMHTMSQILYEKIHPDQSQGNRYLRWSQELLGGFLGTGDQAGIAGMYLQGYGMVFVQQVDFPLVPMFEGPPPVEEPAEPTDEVWQRTQKKLKGEYEEPAEPQAREYDADRVEELQETVSMSLIHASNIRQLDSGEWVVVVVKSLPHRGGFQQHIMPGGFMPSGFGAGRGVMMKADSGKGAGPEQPSFMVVRALKKDIDEFASGRIEQKKFMEKVTVIRY